MIQQLCDTIYLYIHFGFFQFAVWKKKGSWCQKILMNMAGLLVGKHGIWFGSLSKSGELGFGKVKQFNQTIIAKLSWMRLLLTQTSFVSSDKGQVWTYSKKWQRWLKGKDYDMERFWKSYNKCMICRWY